MTIKQARKVLGKDGGDLTDQEVQKCIDTARFFAEIAVSQFLKMTPQERKKYSE